ncbi:hypothetical protein KKH26_01240, partial [Patescibacteria group bacterium]|nr:hypothetical protein [Patescibacteria group bacterium]
MINLLPPKAKEEILLERKKRVVLSNWILVLLFFVFLLSAMFLIKFYLQIQTTYLKPPTQPTAEGARRAKGSAKTGSTAEAGKES